MVLITITSFVQKFAANQARKAQQARAMEHSGTGLGLPFTFGSNMVNGAYVGPDSLGPTQQQDLLDGSQAPTQGAAWASSRTPGVRKSCWLAFFSACTASDLLHPSRGSSSASSTRDHPSTRGPSSSHHLASTRGPSRSHHLASTRGPATSHPPGHHLASTRGPSTSHCVVSLAWPLPWPVWYRVVLCKATAGGNAPFLLFS